jgi:hypothetical protein
VTLSSTNAPSVTVTAPALPGAAELTLVVSNAAVSANPITIPIVVSSSATPVATVNVGPPQVVGLGAPVTITAAASSTNSTEGFSFTWSQTTGSPLALVGASSPTVGFTAPSTAGRLSFTVSATGDAGAFGMAVATVDVEDNVPPVLVSSDPTDAAGASGGWYSLSATFNEALDPGSVNGTNVSLRQGPTNVPVDLRVEASARTIRITPQVPLVPGTAYTLELGALTDASPRRNPFAGRVLPFNARQPRFTTWTRTAGFTTPTFRASPSLAVSSTQVWIVARDATACCTPVPVAFEPNLTDGGVLQRIPIGGATGAAVPPRRGVVVNDVPHVSIPGSPPMVRSGPSTWDFFATTGAVAIASDNTRLVGLTENYGPRWLTFSTPTSAPLDEAVDDYRGSTPPWVGLPTTGNEGAFAVAVAGTRQFVAIQTTTRLIRAYLRQGTGAWQNLTDLAPLPPNAREARAAFNGTTPILCYVHIPPGGRQLSCSSWNGTSWANTVDLGPGTVEELDVFSRGPITWLTYVAGGNLQVKWLRLTGGALSVSFLNGPTGVASWKLNQTCTGSNPESFATADALYVAWEEGCGGQQLIILQKVE